MSGRSFHLVSIYSSPSISIISSPEILVPKYSASILFISDLVIPLTANASSHNPSGFA